MRKWYTDDDIRSAGLVWLSRRDVIEKLLLHENRHLSSTDVRAIVGGCNLYSACSDEMFDQLVAEVERREARSQEVA